MITSSDLHFPNNSIIVNYLQQHLTPSDVCLEKKKIIEVVANAFANQKFDRENIQSYISKICELTFKEQESRIVEEFSKALESYVDGKDIQTEIIQQPSNTDLLAKEIADKMNELMKTIGLTNKIEWKPFSSTHFKSNLFERSDAYKAVSEFKNKFHFPDIGVLVKKSKQKYRITLNLPKDFLISLPLIEEEVKKAEKLFSAKLPISGELAAKIGEVIPTPNLYI